MSVDRHVLEPHSALPQYLDALWKAAQGGRERSRELHRVFSEAERYSARLVEPLPTLRPDAPVSCLMVTCNPWSIVRRSVEAFCNQTYQHKELVVVRDPTTANEDIGPHIAALGRSDINYVRANSRKCLSALRNLAIATAKHDVLANWDDDDIPHPDRLRVQLDVLASDQTSSCFLSECLHYFVTSGEIFVTRNASPLPMHPATAVWRRPASRGYVEEEPVANRAEDTMFFFSLAGATSIIVGEPHLYLYQFHGNNTYDEAHHRRICARNRIAAEPGATKTLAELQRLGLEVELCSDQVSSFFRVQRSDRVMTAGER
jgi:hypothetical protein